MNVSRLIHRGIRVGTIMRLIRVISVSRVIRVSRVGRVSKEERGVRSGAGMALSVGDSWWVLGRMIRVMSREQGRDGHVSGLFCPQRVQARGPFAHITSHTSHTSHTHTHAHERFLHTPHTSNTYAEKGDNKESTHMYTDQSKKTRKTMQFPLFSLAL